MVLAGSMQSADRGERPEDGGLQNANAAEIPREKYYTSISVDYGDTLYDIALEYMTEEYDSVDDYISEIKQINHMHGNFLKQGNYLTIPYYA